MYVSGVSTRKVSKLWKNFVVNNSLTEQLEPMVNEWQNRLLSEKLSLLNDRCTLREENRVLSKSCHIANQRWREINDSKWRKRRDLTTFLNT